MVPGVGVGCARAGGSTELSGDPARVVAELDRSERPRWVVWSAAELAPVLGSEELIGRCHDVAAVHRVLHGGRREDSGAVWAGAAGLPAPPEPARAPRAQHGTGLLDFDTGATGPVDGAGALVPGWFAEAEPAERLSRAAQWAALALRVAGRQLDQLADLPERRPQVLGPPLPLQTAWSESAAALLAVELGVTGLPLRRARAEQVIDEATAARDATEVELRAALPGIDLRNPAAVLTGLRGMGFDLPNTRAWQLERLRATHPVIDTLLLWRKAERLVTTYGRSWLDSHVGPDGRLRGVWSGADAAAGRMTAASGLHNLPAELRVAVAAEEGFCLVRADLGQVEPRVLAAVSGDPGLVAATQDADLYAPVAAALGSDRATAKIAVLAAMYGQTSGAAGAALKDMERTYPRALAYLRSAEAAGREGRDVRTYGGRLVRVSDVAASNPDAVAARGRFARNAVVQGAAAELFKAWAATVRSALPTPGRIVLCLHDELLVHVPVTGAERAVELLHTALASAAGRWAAGSGVRFLAEVGAVQRWSEAK